jgi:hypothetical protein
VTPASRQTSVTTIEKPLSAAFEGVWRDRTPIDAELDDIVADGRLTWEGDQVFESSSDLSSREGLSSSPPSKRRRRLAHLRSMLGDPEPNRVDEKLAAGRHSGKEGTKVPLSHCVRVGDVYDNLSRLLPPAKTTALLCNRGTFFLFYATPRGYRSGEGDQLRKRLLRERRHRLALVLHYVLHNEFFASVNTGSKG